MGHLKAGLSSLGSIDKCLCSFKEKWGESHNKQGVCAPCVCVCVSACEKEGKRSWWREREREKCRDRSKQGLCFWNPVWEVKPHLPRMPCLTPSSPLRFLGASLFLFSLCSALRHLFISHLKLFSESLEQAIWYEPAINLWSELYKLDRTHTLLQCTFACFKCILSIMQKIKPTEHQYLVSWWKISVLTPSRLDQSPSPIFFLPSIMERSKHLFLTQREKQQPDVYLSTQGMSCPLCSMKSCKRFSVALSVS